MDKPHYPYSTSLDGQVYFFDSIGQSTIPKVVVYTLRDAEKQLVELAFGDLVGERIDVYAVAENSDMTLILTTVIGTLVHYLDRFPGHTVFFQGSTPSRTRLYRAVIAKSLAKAELYYEIFGLLSDKTFEVFDKNHQYQAYFIRRKV